MDEEGKYSQSSRSSVRKHLMSLGQQLERLSIPALYEQFVSTQVCQIGKPFVHYEDGVAGYGACMLVESPIRRHCA